MRKIAIFLSFVLPMYLREKFFKLFALSLGKGFDLGSTKKEFESLRKIHIKEEADNQVLSEWFG